MNEPRTHRAWFDENNAPISFPDSEIECELLSLQQRAPVEKQKSGKDRAAQDQRHNSLWGIAAMHEASEICGGVKPGEDHHRVAQKFAAKVRRQRARGLHFRNPGGHEQRRGGQRRHGVNKDEEPALPQAFRQFLSQKCQFIRFVPFDEQAGKSGDVETHQVSSQG